MCIRDSYNVTLAYPGNAYVDVIGLDDYDQTWVCLLYTSRCV